ncbi:MAG: SDR family NAD(P)-dependent oxidoreductase, partial [Geminicoccaceae bacterium]
MEPRFKGKVVLITGGSGGIGLTTAERFAHEGARVVIADLNGDAAKESAGAIAKAGGEAHAIQVDVSEEASVRRMTATIKKVAGPPSILVHCAGIGTTLPLLETDLETWNKT